ncbi:unnamed protein product [Debaryomyces tyrocola]|nr:unnamed protein product [Debaryomyces tyrocola]
MDPCLWVVLYLETLYPSALGVPCVLGNAQTLWCCYQDLVRYIVCILFVASASLYIYLKNTFVGLILFYANNRTAP